MDSFDQFFEDIMMLIDLLKHSSIHLSLEVDARLEEPHGQAMKRKIKTPTDDRGPYTYKNSFRRSQAPYHNVYSGLFPPQTIPSLFFSASSPCEGRNAHSSYCIYLSDPIWKPIRDSILVAWPLLSRWLGLGDDLCLFVKSCRSEVL